MSPNEKADRFGPHLKEGTRTKHLISYFRKGVGTHFGGTSKSGQALVRTHVLKKAKFLGLLGACQEL